MYKEARAPRDYKREYAQYHSKPNRVAERSQRNQARRIMGLKKGDPREVDHKNPISNGGSNARSNLRAVSLVENRKKFTKAANTKHHLITGVPGAGKSTVAKRIAKEKGLPLFEIDSDPRSLKSGRKPYKNEAYYDNLYRDTVYPKYRKQLEGLLKTAIMPMPTFSGMRASIARAVSTNPLKTKAAVDTASRVADVVAEGAPSMGGVILGGQIGKTVGGRVGSAVHRVTKGARPAVTSNTAIQAGTHYSTQLNRYGRKYLNVPKANATGTAYTPQQVQAMIDSGQTTPMMANSYNRLVKNLGQKGVNKYDAGRQSFINTGERVGQNTGMFGGALATVKAASSDRERTYAEMRDAIRGFAAKQKIKPL